MPKKGEEVVDLDVELVHETEKAWLLRSSDTAKESWIPKSVGQLTPNGTKMFVLTLPTSWAQEKGLI